jgi:tetratricopeptide (TPR) repeat protein
MKSNAVPKHMMVLALFLGACTILSYFPALNLGFVNWDDNEYIYENSHILRLTSSFVQWAFTTFHLGNWHPMTWLSLGLDRLLWGTGPMGFHATNIVLHGLNTALVTIMAFLLIEAAKNVKRREGSENGISERGALTAAALTGILFGFHPIHVESVAWISERKDVLCAFFFLTGIMTYLKYVEERSTEIVGVPFFRGHSSRFYFLTLVLFALALLSKPMAVTFPVVLLLLDWHPLGRLERERISAIITEKLPLFALSIASSIVAILAQKSIGDVMSLSDLSLIYRLFNGTRAFVLYLWKMLVPINLIPFYSYHRDVSLLSAKYITILFVAVGIAASCVMLVKSKKGRSWTAAWSYYLITLLPVLGFIQVGSQSMADRYMYLPSLGPFLLAGLGLALVFERKRGGTEGPSSERYYALVIMGVLAISLSLLTLRQTGVWKDGLTLWNYVIEKDPASFAKVYNNRGLIYLDQNRPGEALRDFNTAVASAPGIPKWYFNRAAAYRVLGQYDKALDDLTTVLKFEARNMRGYVHRGNTYFLMGQYDEAISDFSTAILLKPDSAFVYFNRGKAYRLKKQYDKAIDDFSKTVSFDPRFADAYCERGAVYIALARYDEAIADCSAAISINPDAPRYYYNRGTAFIKRGLFEDAVFDFTKAISISAEPKTEYYMNRSNALKKLGRLDEGERDVLEANEIKEATRKGVGHLFR